MIRWRPANDGFVKSHCGEWEITPVYGGLTRPESYILKRRDKVVGSGQNQRECKKIAADLAEKRMRVHANPNEHEPSVYVFEIETARGRRRVYPPGIGRYDEAACVSSELLAGWFSRLKITHVVSEFGESETSDDCVADGKYTAAEYVRWWKRLEDE